MATDRPDLAQANAKEEADSFGPWMLVKRQSRKRLTNQRRSEENNISPSKKTFVQS